MSDEREILEAMARCWPMVVRITGMQPSHCILAARAATETARYFGVTLRERAVSVLVANAKAWELINADVPVDEWPDDAWSIGIDPHDERNAAMRGYAGHVITESPRYLLDLSAPQFNRPRRGLYVEDPLLAPRGDDPADAWTYGDERGTRLVYRPMDDRSYRKMPDWTNRLNWREETAALIRLVRAALVTR
jgi:hypothetical protein